MQPFHLAIPVRDLAEARAFYIGLLGCQEGRSAPTWVDFNFGGHQVVAHLAPELCMHTASNRVDAHEVPVPHFGLVLTMAAWQALEVRLTGAGVHYVVEPYIRFRGEVGEQATLFIRDPSGNALEFKAFADMGRLFAKG